VTGWRALAERASTVGALLVFVPACDGERDAAFELGSGAFPWSSLTITAAGELEPVAEAPSAPPGEWRREFGVDECSLFGIIYGVGWPIPCEGSAAARVEACAPDPELANRERCRVTLDTLALTLGPDLEEPVLEAATVVLANPVVADEGWSGSFLGGPLTDVTGTVTLTGRDGGAPTRYELSQFELQLDYVASRYFLDLAAIKPGW
jgi:hypothetical protein